MLATRWSHTVISSAPPPMACPFTAAIVICGSCCHRPSMKCMYLGDRAGDERTNERTGVVRHEVSEMPMVVVALGRRVQRPHARARARLRVRVRAKQQHLHSLTRTRIRRCSQREQLFTATSFQSQRLTRSSSSLLRCSRDCFQRTASPLRHKTLDRPSQSAPRTSRGSCARGYP